MSTSPLIFDNFAIANIKGRRILDIGCGYGKWGFLARKYLYPQDIYLVGLDAFEPHVHSLKAAGIYNGLSVAKAASLPFGDKSFDSVVACEVLEHMTHLEGLQFVEEVKRVAKDYFVITTPNFSCIRGGSMTLDGFNEYEAHKYNYTYKEFSSLGFTQVIGVGNMQLFSWRLGVLLASLGLAFPKRSRYLMGFWFADGRKRDFSFE